MTPTGSTSASPPLDAADPRQRIWTKGEYYRLADLGMFHNQRAELIEGEIMVLSPQKFAHSAAVDRAAEALRAAFGAGYWVRMQLPLDLGETSEPEPDVSVVVGRREDYHAHPLASDAVLIVEVSDTSLAYDRGEKASLYASAGIADYWLVDLVHGRLEARRSPVADAGARFGASYREAMALAPGQRLSPLALPAATLDIGVLLGTST